MLLKIFNGAFPTTSIASKVTTGTALKTMLQVKTANSLPMIVKGWGVGMDAAAAAVGGQWELITTGAVAATGLTASVAGDIVMLDARARAFGAVGSFSNVLTLGTGATGYATGSAPTEGTVTASQLLHSPILQPTGPFEWEFSLGNEPIVYPGEYLRIRCLTPAAVNAQCWVTVEI